MNIKEMIKDYLKAHGFDGLYNAEMECGCPLNDLISCEYPELYECKAGVKKMVENPDNEGELVPGIGPKEE